MNNTDLMRLKTVLKNRKTPIRAKDLAVLLGIYETDATSPTTRKYVQKAITEYGVPIGSNGNGYFLIRDTKAMQKVMNDLSGRAAAICGRIADLYAACKESGIVT